MPTGFVHKKFLFPPLDNAGFQDYDGEKLISTLNARVLKIKKLHGICRFGKERSIMNAQKYTQKSLEAIQAAQSLALQHQNQQIEQVHLLGALLQQEGGLIPQLLQKMAAPRRAWRRQSRRRSQSFRPSPVPAGKQINIILPGRSTRYSRRPSPPPHRCTTILSPSSTCFWPC